MKTGLWSTQKILAKIMDENFPGASNYLRKLKFQKIMELKLKVIFRKKIFGNISFQGYFYPEKYYFEMKKFCSNFQFSYLKNH